MIPLTELIHRLKNNTLMAQDLMDLYKEILRLQLEISNLSHELGKLRQIGGGYFDDQGVVK